MTNTTAYKLYSLKDITFGKYQQFLVEEDPMNVDFSVLGDAPIEVLTKHRENLYLDFCDATATTDTKSIIIIDANIQHYELRLLRLRELSSALSHGYNPELAELLKEDCDYELTAESYQEDIKKIEVESTQYKILKTQYEADRAKLQGDRAKPTYEYYADVLNAISEMVKYNVDESINTLRYCKYYVQLIKNIEKANNGRRSAQ